MMYTKKPEQMERGKATFQFTIYIYFVIVYIDIWRGKGTYRHTYITKFQCLHRYETRNICTHKPIEYVSVGLDNWIGIILISLSELMGWDHAWDEVKLT
jgi:hypothetical protein